MENNNEMDLIDLFVKLSKLINRSFLKLINHFLKFLKFNIKWSFICIPFIIIGFFSAQYMIKPSNRSYLAEFTLKLNVSDSQSFYSLIESLDRIREFTPDSAAKILDLNELEILKVKEIKAGYVIDNNNNETPDFSDFDDDFVEKDTVSVRMLNYLAVRISGKSRLQYEDIKEKIVIYLNNNPYMQKETAVYRENLGKKAVEIEEQMTSLRQSSASSDFDENTSQIKAAGNTLLLKKNQSYNKELISLMKIQEENFKNIAIYSEAATSTSPVIVKTKHDKPFYYIVLIGGMYFISLILGLLIANRKEVIQFIKE